MLKSVAASVLAPKRSVKKVSKLVFTAQVKDKN
jgi:hypothetical protein